MLEKLKFSFYVIFHPFKGFWELKRENKGSFNFSLCLLAIYVISQIICGQLTGYLFNEFYPEPVNSLLVITRSVGIYFLWCIANWCLTSLMDGDGSLKDIMTAVGYCLIPLIFANVLTTILSNMFSFEEKTFLLYITVISIGWVAFLLFSSTAVVHQYSGGKTVVIMILTVAVMVAFVFVGLLCISLIQQFVSFIRSVYTEIVYRI